MIDLAIASSDFCILNLHHRTNSLRVQAGSNGDIMKCDLYNGTWVRDYGGTIYTNMTCKTLPDTNNCEKYGKDHDFVKWKWQPHGCHLPRFDPEQFLNALRGMNLAFVGDSVARNHKNSLLCMLSQVESPQNTYNDKENQITKWYFQTYNFTVMHLWTRYFVRYEEMKVNGSNTETNVYLDEMDPNWVNLVHEANYVVLSGGHWFFKNLNLYQKNKLIGTVYEKNNISIAVQNAFRTALNYLSSSSGGGNVQLVVVRTFSPTHFEGGVWNSGGSCTRTMPNLDPSPLNGNHLEMRNIMLEEMEGIRNVNRGRGVMFAAMDVTSVMNMRPDAHPGVHWDNRWNQGLSDCTHWCMPGPIDTWNQLLFLTLQRYI
ncbi:Protein ALTERED XYLOGLUCAN 4-like protein [Carex littledalei]|uniref:Protein ALTERED XYLOGLUCAN 4-like protein n=1 Tax=Carex littledalei TaxID=544730 RepID=A0A833VZ88_9POAL|nr:Protein ALTERED XYLOGLUCAN 4-like protein [Carex littledalei]